jgi:hypothetical protein
VIDAKYKTYEAKKLDVLMVPITDQNILVSFNPVLNEIIADQGSKKNKK